MRIAVDTEFNSFGGELISIGMITDDGREFYEVVGLPQDPHPFVQANVLPVLNKIPIGYEGVRRRFHGFMAGLPSVVTLVADWPEDIKHVMDLLLCKEPGECIQKTVQVVLGRPANRIESEVPHHALEDARALGRSFGFLA